MKYYKVAIMASWFLIKEDHKGNKWCKEIKPIMDDPWYAVLSDWKPEGKIIPLTEKEAFLELL